MAVRVRAWKTLPLWVGIIGALAVLGFVLVSELRLQGMAKALPPSKVAGDLILTGFRLSTFHDGEREWELSASRARLFEGDHQARLDAAHGTMQMDDGSVVEFEGTIALFDTVSHDVVIEGEDGGAMVRLPSGYVLRTDRLHWISSRGELLSDDPVLLSGPRLEIQGVGVLIRPTTQELTILDHVRTNVL